MTPRSKLMDCIHCHKSVLVRPYRFESFRFCSRKCLWEWHNKNDRAQKTCAVCGAAFSVIRFRKDTAKHCSKKCYYKAMNKCGTVELTCSVCGTTFRRPPYRAKYKRPCCSIKCRGLLQRTEQPGSAATARNWLARRGFFLVCNRCGYDSHPEILVIHHRDRNRKNNAVENLEILCPNCHAVEHYGASDAVLPS